MSLRTSYDETTSATCLDLGNAKLYLTNEEMEQLTIDLLIHGKGNVSSQCDMLVGVIRQSVNEILDMASFDIPDAERAKLSLSIFEAACDSLRGVAK